MAGPLRDPGPNARRALDDLATGAISGGGAADPTGSGGSEGTEAPVEPLPDAPVGAIDEWTLDQLHRRASEVGLDGRWDMTRDELVAALREV